MHEIKSRGLRSEKAVIGIDIDDIGNLEELLRIVFINEECWNFKIVIERIVIRSQQLRGTLTAAFRKRPNS